MTANRDNTTSDSDVMIAKLLQITVQLAAELSPRRQWHNVGLDSSLDRDLGFDSLGRVELISRLESAFDVALPAQLQAGEPLLPVIIRGTRSILHPDHWFPRRGTVSVAIATPLRETGHDWNAAIRLRDAVRAEILAHCGEPDLSEKSP